ncbi:MAG: hypothetical protein NT116_04645, partial [Candidatus Parcubacteria bacterium]|nr:hypothetical protein [Candidatus Parcubacteria bacterium]
MRKIYIILGIFLISIVIIAVLIMGFLTWQKNTADKQIKKAQVQENNYLDYKFESAEFNKLKRSDKNDIYYYAADGKRYIFPTIETFHSWFKDILPEDIREYDLNQLYQTPLGGNVTLRPGTLMQTPTDANIYLVVKNGQISPINDQLLLTKLFGADWQKQVV